MRISDWSSDVCSSDLLGPHLGLGHAVLGECVAGCNHQRDPEQRCMFHGVDSFGGAGSLRCREVTADEAQPRMVIARCRMCRRRQPPRRQVAGILRLSWGACLVGFLPTPFAAFPVLNRTY